MNVANAIRTAATVTAATSTGSSGGRRRRLRWPQMLMRVVSTHFLCTLGVEGDAAATNAVASTPREEAAVAESRWRVARRHSSAQATSFLAARVEKSVDVDVDVDGEENAVRIGPEGCVSLWTTNASHCMIRTECNNVDMRDYSIQFICADRAGGRTRQMFGTNSFDSEELFDTLIICDRCEPDDGRDDEVSDVDPKQMPKELDLSETVGNLTKEIAKLKVEMTRSKQTVRKLEAKVMSEKRRRDKRRSHQLRKSRHNRTRRNRRDRSRQED
eukprot:TRINITY_DN56074_c0_g1_i1.p1 TRINITY_DN56074_c0_g1~~TRINITY_DN56074_c0_g1_i1.p1  ORF type:complete len:300 (-),score=39.88 TRINITY_DN56074_c0_g1_i1:65-880(-)